MQAYPDVDSARREDAPHTRRFNFLRRGPKNPSEMRKRLTKRFERTEFMHETLSELAELMLAPVLAIVAYFLLYQGSIPNVYMISIVSFAVGLVTKDIVERLENFARSNVGSTPTSTTQTPPSTPPPNRSTGIS